MAALSKGAMGAVGAASGTSLAALGAYKFLIQDESKSITSLLASKNPNKRRLVKSDSGEESSWQASWLQYRKDFHSGDKNPFSLTWTKETTPASTKAPSEFMSACETQGTKMVKDVESQDYQLFLKYCTRDTLMSDLVSENPRKQALTKENAESSNADWVAVWKEYKTANPYSAGQKGQWELSDWEGKHNSEKVPLSFMTKCESELNKPYFNIEGSDYRRVISWCTKDAPT
ncbi:hypothetical protein HF1_11120 [Mycoplasma haemofelis str. Langford 1]|uniref:Uncharacterized protein n=1 Tax=Mycoplasma haemofelis (strain Langford 1) TaxID=941640 RepID=E8ZIZ9_MYCHL|nr:hypothetical protein [Mycoplasma haemofelis]CBY93120.1 hypothetical protein HF1_11120 [Mycoplasma haemofelis str. Langford 1]